MFAMINSKNEGKTLKTEYIQRDRKAVYYHRVMQSRGTYV